MQPIRIVMADDHKMIIHSLAEIISKDPRMQVQHIVPDGARLLQYLNNYGKDTDVAILDLHMPQLDGLSVVPLIKSRFPHMGVLVLSMYYTPQILQQVRGAGADCFVHKADDISHLLTRIEQVSKGEKHFPTYQTNHSQYTNEVGGDAYMKVSVLTEREKQIARHIRDGYTTPKIAALLHLSEYTIDTHRKNILRKLELKSSAELIRFATENKL